VDELKVENIKNKVKNDITAGASTLKIVMEEGMKK
jgi:hypothetical protein